MFTEIARNLRPAVVLLLLLAVVTGLAYPAAITGIAQLAFPAQADGSLIKDGDRIVGSELIAQNFTGASYLHPRPSAAGKGYDASSSGATNLAPGSKDLRDAIAGRIKDARAEGITGPIPGDMVTSSASGLDPDISPETALLQAPRIAKARGLPEERVREVIAKQTEYPFLGIIGDAHVNVLLTNRQLDRVSANPKP